MGLNGRAANSPKDMSDAANVEQEESMAAAGSSYPSRGIHVWVCACPPRARASRISEYSDIRTTPIRIVSGAVESGRCAYRGKVDNLGYRVARAKDRGWIYTKALGSRAVIIFLLAMKRAVVTHLADLLCELERTTATLLATRIPRVHACAYNNGEHILQFILLWDLW